MKLKEICNFREGYVNPPQGIADYFDGPVKWVRANDVNFAPIYSTSRTLSLQGFKSAGKSAILFKPDTIVVTKSGTIGRSAIIKDFMCGNRAIINVELKNNDKIDTKFVYYFLSTNQPYLQSLAVGTTQLNLYIFNLQEVEIPFPEKQTRQHIVNTISFLLLKSILLFLLVLFPPSLIQITRQKFF